MSERQQVVVGLIRKPDDRGKVLMAHRGPTVARPSLWEYPGGKVEKNEPPQRALHRELEEELGIQAYVGGIITNWSVNFEIPLLLSLYEVTRYDGIPQPLVATGLVWEDPLVAIVSRPMVPSCYVFFAAVMTHLGRVGYSTWKTGR
jgi:8-oxo-dGTP diphosphatase